MTAGPLIGLSTRRWPVRLMADAFPAAYADADFDVGLTDYSAALARAGAVPVHLARDAPAADVVAHLDALVVTGGADVDPATYGAQRTAKVGRTEPGRDAWEIALMDAALERAVPVLAICRGLQLLNAARRGTLFDDLPDWSADGHARFGDDRHRTAHLVATEPGSLAATVFGPTCEVNSLHHQCIDRLGEGLVVAGRSPDGTIEVVELPGQPVLGVQWHPEALADDPAIRWVVEAARSATGKAGTR